MKINYPVPKSTNNITIKTVNKYKSYGMMFENELNASNDYYNSKGIALIYKKPTPIQVVKVDYPSRNKAKITEAYYKTPSTTDYNGLYKGKYIDYEVKEVNKDYFPFAHIKPHQIEHLRKATLLGGITFVIIYYRIQNEVILIDFKKFDDLYINSKTKSITYEKATEIGKIINISYAPSIDYLKAVDEIYKWN